eukprot:175487-Rhodomonas_salina.1
MFHHSGVQTQKNTRRRDEVVLKRTACCKQFWVAYGNRENQQTLIQIPGFLTTMAKIIEGGPNKNI